MTRTAAGSAAGPAARSTPTGALDALFGALADPTRRSLLVDLVEHGPQSATRLGASSPLTRQAVVKHLQALEAAGLVAPQRVGREVRYRATPEPLAAAVGWLLDSGARWDRRIDRLRDRSQSAGPRSGVTSAPGPPSTRPRGAE